MAQPIAVSGSSDIESLKLPGARNNGYLERLARGDAPVIVVICGPSGSGKSTMAGFLIGQGAESGERLLPREVRPGDTPGDKPWLNDRRSWSAMAFCQRVYRGIYGFPAQPIVAAFRNNPVGQVHILGRAFEIGGFIEAMNNLLPGAPIVVIRPKVARDILQQRVVCRYKDDDPERAERLCCLGNMLQADEPQLDLIERAYGLAQIDNIAPSEASQSQAPLTSTEFMQQFEVLAAAARSRSSNWARDLLTTRSLSLGHPYIPDALTDVLVERLIPQARQAGVPMLIKGGLGVALLLNNSRPVSPDIDFVVPEFADRSVQVQRERQLEGLLANLGITCKVADNWSKKVYHVRGAHGALVSERFGGVAVDLDGITETRLQARNSGFCFEMQCDQHDVFNARRVNVTGQNGEKSTILVVPPEHLIVEKLLAGRGPELQKFDLFDVAGLLSQYEPSPGMVRKLIERQKYDPTIDFEIAQILRNVYPTEQPEHLLQCINPTNEEIIKLLKLEFREVIVQRQTGVEGRVIDLEALKEIALCDRAIESLGRVEQMYAQDQLWQLGDKSVTIRQHFDCQHIVKRIGSLRALFLSYALFEAGRCEIYVKSPLAKRPPQDIDRFFRHVAVQKHTLNQNNKRAGNEVQPQ